MRTEEVKVYQFDELSEGAKEKALNDARDMEVAFPDWWHAVYDQWTEKLEEIGYTLKTRAVGLMGGGTRHDPDIQFTGFWSQGDGASFTSYVDVDKVAERIGMDDDLARLRDLLRDGEWDPEGEDDVDLFEVSIDRSRSAHYVHEMTMTRSVHPWYLDADTRTEEQQIANRLADAILDDAREQAQELYKSLEQEHEFLTSDEVVAEGLQANEVEFTEDGERW